MMNMFFRLACCTALFSLAASLPIQMTVNQRTSECLYEILKEGEHVTVSIFILAGPSLKANVQVHGPVAPSNIDSGIALQQAMEKFDSGHKHTEENIEFKETVDFEELAIHFEEDQEEEEQIPEDETAEQRRERRAKERKKVLEARQRAENHKVSQRKRVREEGEPFQQTFKAPVDGWYRFCVEASWYQVTAEIDVRKESEMGGLGENGHVWSLTEKAMAEEDKLMEEDTASLEGIKDEDFQSTRDKLRSLRHLLADIQSKQQQERHRLIVHAATNEHSHSRMVLGSLLETVMFMAVTGYQVYTIRRWFKGAPVLGR